MLISMGGLLSGAKEKPSVLTKAYAVLVELISANTTAMHGWKSMIANLYLFSR